MKPIIDAARAWFAMLQLLVLVAVLTLLAMLLARWAGAFAALPKLSLQELAYLAGVAWLVGRCSA